jgi:hypothetical protein
MTRTTHAFKNPLPRARALAPLAAVAAGVSFALSPGFLRSGLLAGKAAILAAGISAACSSSAQAQTIQPVAATSRPVQPVHESPYSIDLLGPDGRTLPTYAHSGRFYVLGDAGQRYTVRVRNPTPRRIEAVISIDGLDAIDGEPANYARKRGYIVPARGEVRIDGFRVSEQGVAAFRFSSVAGSYAGRKGMPRNVGVIGVAIFEEAPRHDDLVIAQRDRRPPPTRSPRSRSGAGSAEMDSSAPPPAASGAPNARSEAAPAPRRSRDYAGADYERPGLGTGFGEYRHAPVSWTRFERAHPRRPTAIAELRYNDAPGLAALGIQLRPGPDHHEVWTRETASPFPFARPPGY